MRKFKFIIATFLLVATTVGCSKEVNQGSVNNTNTSANQESSKTENNTEKVVRENGMEKTPLFTNKDLNVSGDVGGVKYNYKAVQVSKIKLYTQKTADSFGIEKDKEFACVVFDVEVENTTDKDISFYPDMAKLITNTKEQVEPNMFLSDGIGGDYLGNVKKDGTIIYLLPNTNAEDLKTLEVRIDAPHDSNYDKLGNDIKLNFELN